MSGWRPALRFFLLFALLLGAMALLFEYGQSFFATLFMYPVSALAVFLLNGLGLEASLDLRFLGEGFCDLLLGGAVYRIIHECTGLFALLAYLALVLAYPASAPAKIQGALLGIPAFFTYSALRLVILGLVAHWRPDWVELFHLYLMVLVNLGFLLFVWVYWLHRIAGDE